jgi:hypothetical protein
MAGDVLALFADELEIMLWKENPVSVLTRIAGDFFNPSQDHPYKRWLGQGL